VNPTLRTLAADLALAALACALVVLVVEFSQGPGIQFVYFAF
jgi:hypothetical protein